MSVDSLTLRKLLKFMHLGEKQLVSALRRDVLEDRRRYEGGSGGGDFYGPFWKDAKDHVFGRSDLRTSTAQRVASNEKRRNLYPQLRDGFLLWWDRKRRWTNTPFEQLESPTARYRIPGTEATIKIDCILSVKDGRDDNHFVYPYWFPVPQLDEQAARIGLWLLSQALPHISPEEMRLLDVIRGETFALTRSPLVGDEKIRVSEKMNYIKSRWDAIDSGRE